MRLSQILDKLVKDGEINASSGNPLGWDGWDEVDAATIDKAFERLDAMHMDAKTLKVLVLESLGVTAGNINGFAETGELDGVALC